MSAAAGERLNRYLARRGVASRRGADLLIQAGRVTVNGRTGLVGSVVDAERDAVTVDGRHVAPPTPPLTLVLHKPLGVVTTRHDPQGRQTVMDYVEPLPGLVSIGRLDADSRGLLLLTTGGELAHRVAHPSYGILKRYVATVDSRVGESEALRLMAGVQLEDGIARAVLAEPDGPRLELIMGEGRKREVRRMCGAVGLEVTDLLRVAVGPVELGELAEGEARHLSGEEDGALRAAVGLQCGTVVTIDGPAGSGKSTLGRRLALALGLPFIDTGLFYRAVTVAAAATGVTATDDVGLAQIARHTSIRLDTDPRGGGDGVQVDGRRVAQELYDPACVHLLAGVSATAAVRALLLLPQRELAGQGAVAVGRDCGTVVYPWARVKLYLQAGEETRRARRARQLQASGRRLDAAALEAEVAARDRSDSSRRHAPLRAAPDAHVIDTSSASVDEVLAQALEICASAGVAPP